MRMRGQRLRLDRQRLLLDRQRLRSERQRLQLDRQHLKMRWQRLRMRRSLLQMERTRSQPRRTRFAGGRISSSRSENEVHRSHQAKASPQKVQLDRLLHVQHGEWHEHRERDDLLKDLQL